MAKKPLKKYYLTCDGCIKKLSHESEEKLCKSCKIKEFDLLRKQEITLKNYK